MQREKKYFPPNEWKISVKNGGKLKFNMNPNSTKLTENP
jgi:hypothetical protein